MSPETVPDGMALNDLPEQCEECESTGQNCSRHQSLKGWVRQGREEEKAAEREKLRAEIELEVRRELAAPTVPLSVELVTEPLLDLHKIGDVLQILAELVARLSGDLTRAAIEVSSLAPPVKERTHEQSQFLDELVYAQQQAGYPEPDPLAQHYDPGTAWDHVRTQQDMELWP